MFECHELIKTEILRSFSFIYLHLKTILYVISFGFRFSAIKKSCLLSDDNTYSMHEKLCLVKVDNLTLINKMLSHFRFRWFLWEKLYSWGGKFFFVLFSYFLRLQQICNLISEPKNKFWQLSCIWAKRKIRKSQKKFYCHQFSNKYF